MAYSSIHDSVYQILNAKKNWESIVGDDDEANKQRKQWEDYAAGYYKNLKNSGQSALANQLKNSDAKQSQGIYDDLVKTAKSGQSGVRQQSYDLGSGYGLSQSEIDSILHYDTDTGEVSIGGVNLGKPNAEIDGTAYYDPETVKGGFNTYVSNTGLTPTMEKAAELGYNQANKNLQANRDYIINAYEQSGANGKAATDFIQNGYNDLLKRYDSNANYTKNYNPYTTDIADAIMSNYNLKGYESANNAKASSAATNGGNIDSYAAANAARQQLAYTNAGTQAVLQDYANRLNYLWGGYGTLADSYNAGGQNMVAAVNASSNSLGALADALNGNSQLELTSAQQQFDNSETAKNNELARQEVTSEITGTIPKSLASQDNPFLDSSGKLLKAYENIDFQEEIDKLWSELANAPDDATRRYIRRQINYLNEARKQKIENNPDEYGQYAGSILGWIDEDTGSMRSAKEEADLTRDITNSTNATNIQMNENDNQTTLKSYDAGAEANIKQDAGLRNNAFDDTVRTDNYNESKGISLNNASSGESSTALNGDKPYPETSTVSANTAVGDIVNYRDIADGIANWLEEQARNNGLPEVLIPGSNGDYHISNEEPGYKAWVRKTIEEYANEHNLGAQGLNELLHRYNLI